MPEAESLFPDRVGFRGEYYAPATPSRSGVVVIGGSAGSLGVSAGLAEALASAGHPALAVQYFGAEGLPAQLTGVPLEIFRDAARWLAGRPEVDPDRVVLLGASRGAEAALLAGAVFREVCGVIAAAPAHVAFQGLGGRRSRPRSAWSIAGVPLPFVPFRTPFKALFKLIRGDNSAIYDIHVASLRARSRVAEALIPVERIGGPVLLLSGGDDRLWPAGRMAEAVRMRLAARAFPHPFHHAHYPAAGHIVCSPVPVPEELAMNGRRMHHGGTAAGNRKAQSEGWNLVLEFLAGEALGAELPRRA